MSGYRLAALKRERGYGPRRTVWHAADPRYVGTPWPISLCGAGVVVVLEEGFDPDRVEGCRRCAELVREGGG